MERALKAAIVHDSRTGNGNQIAQAIAQVCRDAGAEVRVGHYSELDATEIADFAPDFLVAGSAIRAFMLSGVSKTWLRSFSRELRRTGGTVRQGVAFVTHGLPRDKADFWGRRFRRRVASIPGIAAVDPEWHSGRVLGQEGPLEDGTIDRFRELARRLLE